MIHQILRLRRFSGILTKDVDFTPFDARNIACGYIVRG